MNELKIFEKAEFGQIRTVVINEKSYFVASDVARALGYTNSSKAIMEENRNKQYGRFQDHNRKRGERDGSTYDNVRKQSTP